MEDPKLSIPDTNKTLKVNRGGDGSPLIRISDFMIFIKVLIATWKKYYMNHVTVIVIILRGTVSIYSTV